MKRTVPMAAVLGLLAAAAVTAATAGAEPEPLTGEPWQIYAKTHNARVCQFIRRHPSSEGMQSALKDISIESGMSSRDSGLALGMSIFGKCPQYTNLLYWTAPRVPDGILIPGPRPD